ncbi:4-hydroxybutyrate dehydrogenase [Betaproteobacteria bacterium]|nr:4-hydroxybutyrate dehydrogenase [Betaproteobacteria bacterium]
MISFQIKPKLQQFSSFKEFVKEAAPGPDDILFTQRFLYEAFMKDLPCQTLFYEDYCTGEPSNVMIDAMLGVVGKMKYSRMIAIGGGTVLDSSKLLNIDGATNTEKLFNDPSPPTRSKGLIMIPTTCGTGCEVTGVAVIDFPSRGAKIGKRFECSFADTAVLIGEMVRGLPYDFFIYSSVDALIHAMEIYVAPTATEYSDMYCEKAMRKILCGYAELLKHGPEKRYEMLDSFLLASNLAGIALANVLCGAVHAMAMHFGSAHHVPHGESNSRFLMGVFSAYAAKDPDGKLKGMARIISDCLGVPNDTQTAFSALNDMLRKLIPQKKLTDYGMKREDAGAYADKVIETQQRLLVNNYAPLKREDFMAIYDAAC